MRSTFFLCSLLFFVSLATHPASAEPLRVTVGSEGTLVHLAQRLTRVSGEGIGRLGLDTRAVKARCLANGSFRGIVRLVPKRTWGRHWAVTVECLGDAQPDPAIAAVDPIELTPR